MLHKICASDNVEDTSTKPLKVRVAAHIANSTNRRGDFHEYPISSHVN
jgi:hypothetical protein